MPIYNGIPPWNNTALPTNHPFNIHQSTDVIPPYIRPLPPKRRPSRWDRALMDVRKSVQSPDNNSAHYRRVSPTDVIAALGNINPVYRGKPKKLPMKLLQCAAFATVEAQSLTWTGLTYRDHFVIGKYKGKGKLTAPGLRLLEYWADKYPAFKPFFEAYVPKKARKEILADSFDLEMGKLPKRVLDLIEKNDVIQKKRDEILKTAAEIEQANREYVNRRSQVNTQSYNDAQRQLMYQQMMQQQQVWKLDGDGRF